MKSFPVLLFAAFALAGCLDGTNPLVDNPKDTDLDLPPGTDNASPGSSIVRYEEEDAQGSGYAQSITYDPGSDTFSVDNLAFDGDGTYARDSDVPTLGAFRVYENDDTYADDVTGTPILQYLHRAVITEGASGNTSVAIVRTGNYTGYGFGGFMYARDGGVVLPTSGQAAFTGAYAGIRDFKGVGGLEYVTGDADASIDFDDFNDGNGVRIYITNRQIWDLLGNDITGDVVTAMGGVQTFNPDLRPVVGSGAMNLDGEMTRDMFSTYIDGDGKLVDYERGYYYGLLSGEGADMELVGVIVVEGQDPRFEDPVTVRETGGFVLER